VGVPVADIPDPSVDLTRRQHSRMGRPAWKTILAPIGHLERQFDRLGNPRLTFHVPYAFELLRVNMASSDLACI
jgi:hypothetical protein